MQASINRLFRENANLSIIKLTENEEFRSRSKAGQGWAFTRNRVLTLKDLLVFIIRGKKNAYNENLTVFIRKQQKAILISVK